MNRITRDQSSLPALVLIGLGAFFLLTQVFSWGIGTLWPFFVILPGLPFLFGALRGRSKDDAGFIFPGIIITGTGLLLLYQSITGHWESWAYAWALYPLFVGMALQFHGKRTEDREEVRTGRGMVTFATIGLVVMWVVFEVFIFGSVLGGLSGWLIPALMVAAGLFLLNRGASSQDDVDDAMPEMKHKNLAMHEAPAEKPKNDRVGLYTDDALRRRIDAALAEDDN